MHRWAQSVVCFGAGLALASIAHAQMAPLPEPLHLVVPLPAGGTLDAYARMLAQQISERGGPTTIVENRTGAGTLIGTQFVARARPDGGTLLIGGPAFLIDPLVRKGPVNPLDDFDPVCRLNDSAFVVVVDPRSRYRGLKDLVVAAGQRNGGLSIGAAGPVTPQHMIAEGFRMTSGANLTFVPYAGDGPALIALAGGQIDAVVSTALTLRGPIAAGQLRPLAVSTARRAEWLPETPTIGEQGYAFELSSWSGVWTTAKTPAPVRRALETIVAKARSSKPYVDLLHSAGTTEASECGADFAAWQRAEYAKLSRTIHDAGVKVE